MDFGKKEQKQKQKIFGRLHRDLWSSIREKKEGNELDEFNSHKFLETLGETKTVIQLREQLRKIDLDANGKMALLEYLCFKYEKPVTQLITSPQGDNKEEIDEASAKLEAIQVAFDSVQQQLQEQTIALEKQKKAEIEAKRTLDESTRATAAAARALEDQLQAQAIAQRFLDEQQAAEEVVRKAEAELKRAVDELAAQEEEQKNKINDLTAKSVDLTASTVTKNRAAAELAQVKQEDPLPLRRAKTTQEAALRKVEKERKAAQVATGKATEKSNLATESATKAAQSSRQAEEAQRAAEASSREAEEATRASEEQTKRVEAAARDCEDKLKEAMDFLEAAKNKGGVAHGAVWWMEREIIEKKKYMPKKKQ